MNEKAKPDIAPCPYCDMELEFHELDQCCYCQNDDCPTPQGTRYCVDVSKNVWERIERHNEFCARQKLGRRAEELRLKPPTPPASLVGDDCRIREEFAFLDGVNTCLSILKGEPDVLRT